MKAEEARDEAMITLNIGSRGVDNYSSFT